MRWNEELREQLAPPECVRELTTFDEREAEREVSARELLRMHLCVAGEVFRVAHRVLVAANRGSMLECGHDLHGLSLGERLLEVKPGDDGLTLDVTRETGRIDTLRVEGSSVFDRHGNLIPYAESYFGSLVLELATR